MKTFIRTSIVAGVLLLTTVSALETDKVTLNKNCTLVYNQLPKSVDNLQDAFQEGMVYGRLRMNTFYWDWSEEIDGKQKDNRAMGIGGSLIYKTAPLNGLSAAAGLYTTQNPDFFREDKENVGYVKAGKDSFERNNIKNGGGYDGHFGMSVLGQAYLQYDISQTTFIGGRQLFESLYTKSNDTKMIPNTFDGLSMISKEIPQTSIKLAYFAAQKLRDHTNAHDVIAYDSWNENDDSAVNKSLTPDLVGTDNELIIASATNKSVENLKAAVNYMIVPDVVSNVTLEAHYKIPLGAWSITPGMRYMKQMDELGTNISVANLKAKADGYTNPTSLDSALIAGRVDFKNGPMLVRLGYSEIDDKADIVAPWRGFPTGGFSRAMAQYNWYANTKTSMIRFDYDFNKAGMLPGFRLLSRYAIQDFDDAKPGVQADSNILHIDMFQKLAENLEMKIRLGFVDADDNIQDINGNTKTDVSYNEYRLEFNYFF
ncbi:MAG: OprD family outer membrane porin [Campylobacterota bacterium]|nr:OprD family outer membrane porin [Campylobacterota bacterium]